MIKIPAAFIVLSVLWVLLLKWCPVLFTPLMIQRSIEFRGDESFSTHFKWVPYEKISPEMARAVIASEDNLFEKHDGFDRKAIEQAREEVRTGKRKQMRGRVQVAEIDRILFRRAGLCSFRAAGFIAAVRAAVLAAVFGAALAAVRNFGVRAERRGAAACRVVIICGLIQCAAAGEQRQCCNHGEQFDMLFHNTHLWYNISIVLTAESVVTGYAYFCIIRR